MTPEDLKKIPVEVGLQTETGRPTRGVLDYAAPTITAATGTLACAPCCPTLTVRCFPAISSASACREPRNPTCCSYRTE